MRFRVAIVLVVTLLAAGFLPARVSPAATVLGIETRPDGTIQASLVDADLRKVLQALAEMGGLQLILDPEVEGRVTVEFDGVTRKTAIKTILRTHGLSIDAACSRPIVDASGSGSKGPRTVLTIRPASR